MDKTYKVKAELMQVGDLVEVVEVLKEVADMKYHALSAQKVKFNRFRESFADFFSLVVFSQVKHPLINSDNPQTIIMVISTEHGFVGDLNSYVVGRALEEKEGNPQARFVVVGKKGVEVLAKMGEAPAKIYEDIEEHGFYEVAIEVKNYLVKEVMEGRAGKVVAVYPWPKDYLVIKPRAVKLLPCEDLLPKQTQTIEEFWQVIEESDPVDITEYLVDLWLSSKIYELFFDANLAAAAAQSQQLYNSLERMNKELGTIKLRYNKARRGEIDKNLREIFSVRMMASNGGE